MIMRTSFKGKEKEKEKPRCPTTEKLIFWHICIMDTTSKNHVAWISASSQDRMTETRFTLPSEAIPKAPDTFDDTAVFKTPSTSDEWEWSREMRTTEVSPTVAPEYCLERVSRPWHKEEKVRQDAVVPWVEETEPRWEELPFIGQNTREKRGVPREVTWRAEEPQ